MTLFVVRVRANVPTGDANSMWAPACSLAGNKIECDLQCMHMAIISKRIAKFHYLSLIQFIQHFADKISDAAYMVERHVNEQILCDCERSGQHAPATSTAIGNRRAQPNA